MNALIRWFISVLTCNIWCKNNVDTINEYEIIMKKIRNGKHISNEELLFVNNLPRETLLEIIDINNTVIEQLNGIINYKW